MNLNLWFAIVLECAYERVLPQRIGLTRQMFVKRVSLGLNIDDPETQESVFLFPAESAPMLIMPSNSIARGPRR
jgi:hypothetical protein